MNELSTITQQLPDTIEDLTQFVLVGKAKLQAYMLKLQTVNKLSVAQEIRDQTLQEAQEISTALIAAEQRIGEILLSIPKAQGRRTDIETSSNDMEEVKTKSEVVSEMGYTRNDVSDYQRMAQNPEVVQMVIDNALENGEVVTKSQVMKEIKAATEKAKAEAEANKTTREKFAERKADRLQTENEQLKSKVATLENMEPRVVVPDDYEVIKKRASSYEKENKMLMNSRSRDAEEIKRLKTRLEELEARNDIAELQKKLETEAGYFAIRTYDFIQKNGGYVWITERLKDLKGDSRKQFINAVYAIDAFAKQMVENIGGYGIE